MTTLSTRLRGAFTALITPFRDGRIDVPALRALVERQIQGGIDGLVPCGTTGEAATMSQDEQLEVIRVVTEQNAGRVPVIAGTGTNDTHKTLAFTRKVSEIPGVDAALVVCPYYNKPNQPMLVRHFTEIAEAAGLPVVLYNVPGRTVISMTPETVATLAAHEQVVGIKEATGSMKFAAEVFEACAGLDIAMLSGDDFTTMPFVASGGHGCISVLSNLDPRGVHDLIEATRNGDLESARSMHLKLQAITRALFERPNPVPTKEIAARLGWCTAEVRPPLYGSEPAFLESLYAIMDAYGLRSNA